MLKTPQAYESFHILWTFWPENESHLNLFQQLRQVLESTLATMN